MHQDPQVTASMAYPAVIPAISSESRTLKGCKRRSWGEGAFWTFRKHFSRLAWHAGGQMMTRKFLGQMVGGTG
ncbi:MAG: hypothetical protein MK100_07235, partial [Phycisphaerales bacterium]|nr:hypothetical protein [Phycisphaerales bacterium]